VVDVCYFGVVHKTVDDASMRVLHGGGAVKVATVANRGDWGENCMDGVWPHYPTNFSPNEHGK